MRGFSQKISQLSITALIFTLLIMSQKALGDNEANINQGAQEGSDSQETGTAINSAVGAVFSKVCSTKYGAWACPLAAMAFQQAVHHAISSGQSNGVYEATKYSPHFLGDSALSKNGDPSSSYLSSNPSSVTGSRSASQLKILTAKLKKLEQMGYKVNPEKGTVTTPNKGEVPMNAFNSAESMAKAGYDKASIAAAQFTIKKLNANAKAKHGDRAKVTPIGVVSRGGGYGRGGGGYKTNFNSDSNPMTGHLASLWKKKMHRKPSSENVAGMKRIVDGEPIGVAMDDIFEMVHRRYQKKRQANTFIEIEAPKNNRKKYNF